jgi:DNA-directed RNA polymerase specialized sigma24 family protein
LNRFYTRAGLGKSADISRVEQFATASAPFRAHVFTAALWYGGSDRAYAERVYRRTFALLFASGSEVRRVSAGRALAKALQEVERPRVTGQPTPPARRPDYSEIVSGMAPDHAIPMLLVGVLGLSYEQVADALDVRFEEVRRRVFLARDTIVRRLGLHAALHAETAAQLRS